MTFPKVYKQIKLGYWELIILNQPAKKGYVFELTFKIATIYGATHPDNIFEIIVSITHKDGEYS